MISLTHISYDPSSKKMSTPLTPRNIMTPLIELISLADCLMHQPQVIVDGGSMQHLSLTLLACDALPNGIFFG